MGMCPTSIALIKIYEQPLQKRQLHFLELAALAATILPNYSSKHGIWYDTDGPPGAGCTLNHHSLDPYGGRGMVQQQLKRCLGWLRHKFWLGIEGTALITHWIHMEDMEWFSMN
jgi:hypothetical protein